MIRKLKYILLFTFTFLLWSPALEAFAHPGGMDDLGGHFRKTDCVYILHSPTKKARSAENVNALIQMIKGNSGNSTCSQGLTADKVQLNGMRFGDSAVPVSKPATIETAPATPEAFKRSSIYQATLKECVDGDTAEFKVGSLDVKTRFLFIDTPESTNTSEPYGKEASEFTCSFLKKGEISLQTDGNNVYDKYGRLLAWVWINDQLHQEEITRAGLVEDFYDYGNYLYEDHIRNAMAMAKKDQKGIYSGKKESIQNENSKESDKPATAGSIILLTAILAAAGAVTYKLKNN